MKRAGADRALILARGASRRMGFPKGLARTRGSGREFLIRIVDLYRTEGVPVLVVAGPDSSAAYAAVVTGREDVDLLAAPAGGDTARTIGVALRHLGESGERLWIHPVDLPEVRRATLARLREAAEVEVVVRPFRGPVPGHPVVVTAGLLRTLDRALGGDGEGAGLIAREDSMGHVLDEAARAGLVPPVRRLPVDDPGVVRDFDDQEEIDDRVE